MSKRIRLFCDKDLNSNSVVVLSLEQSHYIKNVMRVKVGGLISLFNDKNGEWDAKIINNGKKFIELKIEKQSKNKEIQKDLWLAFSLIKKNSLDMLIQKGTELGVKKFIPILSQRSIVKEINIKRLKKIIIEACEQSKRVSVPEIKSTENLKDFLINFPKNGKLIFCDINSNKEKLNNILPKKNKVPICILIGPEGDFSESERQSIIDMQQSVSLSLASNILRAETAAIAAVTIVNYQLNSSSN